jgi:conserved oligomeric Golgi complex subunit 5
MGKGGEMTDDLGPPSVLQNPVFVPFQQEQFNVAEFVSRVLAGSQTTAQAQSEQLREGVRVLDGELASQVTSRNKELLGNVRRMLDAENSLADVVLSVETLQSAVRRIRAEIAGPYEHIKARTCQLRNLHATVGMLRHLIHRIKLAQKLRQQMAAPASQLDLAKAAKLLTDIHAVDAEVDLTGVDAVDADAAFLAEASKTIHDQAEVCMHDAAWAHGNSGHACKPMHAQIAAPAYWLHQ